MSNKIAFPEEKEVDYSAMYRNFTEYDVDSGESESGVFKLDDPISGKIIRNDKYTVVLFEDGSRGVAECASDQNYSRRDGTRLAYLRAMVEHFQRMIDKYYE